MMRNRFPGRCYRCAKWVPEGEGHFERIAGGWRVQHAECAIQWRGVPDALRTAENQRRHAKCQQQLEIRAKGTGRAAQRARRALRDQSTNPKAGAPEHG